MKRSARLTFQAAETAKQKERLTRLDRVRHIYRFRLWQEKAGSGAELTAADHLEIETAIKQNKANLKMLARLADEIQKKRQTALAEQREELFEAAQDASETARRETAEQLLQLHGDSV